MGMLRADWRREITADMTDAEFSEHERQRLAIRAKFEAERAEHRECVARMAAKREAFYAMLDATMARNRLIHAAILDAVAGGKNEGVIGCPSCGGNLVYGRPNEYGKRHAKCTGTDCIDW